MNLPGIREFLESLHGKEVFFDPLHGNHGDHLIRLAAVSMLQDAGLALATEPQSSDFILLNGGGSMTDGWFGFKQLDYYCRQFPSHPLAIMPSSFHPTRTDLAELIGLRQAHLWLWARERPSLELLGDAGLGDHVSLGLDHDLAFALQRHPLIKDLREVDEQNLVLVVERDDWEGPTGRRRPLAPSGLAFIPERIRTAVRKTVLGPYRRRQDRISAFRNAALKFVREAHPETMRLEPLCSDISLAETCSFRDFLQYVARASVIVTTRLHVAILGHMLGRRTYLVAGIYHKYQGVFDYSLKGASTRLLRWDGTKLG